MSNKWRILIFRFLAIFFWITVGSVPGLLVSLVFIVIASVFMTIFETEVREDAVREYLDKWNAREV